MKLLLTVVMSLAISIIYCQQNNFSFAIQPGATSLLDSAEKENILVALNGFLQAKNRTDQNNPFIDPAYLKSNSQPFHLLIDAERSDTYKDNSFYKPHLLTVLPIVNHQQYLVKLSYIGITSQGIAQHGMTYALLVKKVNSKYFFYNSIDYNTRHWNDKQVGSITYIYPNTLDVSKARQMDAFNQSIVKMFSIGVIPVTYYKCQDPEQLFRIMGCDYIPNMYFATTGGYAEGWHNTLYAGNNSEWYPHEIVHLYTAKRYPNCNQYVDEGYATFLGGSGGQPLQKLKESMKSFLQENPDADITEMFINFKRVRGLQFTYIISGLICKDIEDNLGFAKIKELFTAGPGPEDYFVQLEKIIGVTKDQFPQYVRDLLKKE